MITELQTTLTSALESHAVREHDSGKTIATLTGQVDVTEFTVSRLEAEKIALAMRVEAERTKSLKIQGELQVTLTLTLTLTLTEVA